MQSKDYAKYQEIEHLIITQSDDDVIFEYMQNQKWLNQYGNEYILNLNMIYIDLIYGKKNRLLNEFLYEYIHLKKEEVVPTLKYILSQIQTISTNFYKFIINNISKKQKPEKIEKRDQIIEQEFDLIKNMAQNKLQLVYNKFEKQQDVKNNSLINEFIKKLHDFNNEKINKSQLIEGLVFKNGIYYKNNIPVLQQSQIEQKHEEEDEEHVQMETQIYVFSISSEYYNFIELETTNQEKLIHDTQIIVDEFVQDFIAESNKGAIDYYIRLTILALYKYQFDRYNLIFDPEIYQKILQHTEKETLKFRQSIGTEISIDVNQIVDQWWTEIEGQGKLKEDDEQQEVDINDLETEDVIPKLTKTMD